MRKTECSRPFGVLPALLVLCGFAIVDSGSLMAQDRYRVTRTENLRQQPGPQETRLGRVETGVVLPAPGSRGQWLQVEVAGWIWSRSIGRANSGDFTLRVTAQGGENLRDGPNGSIIGRFLNGTFLNELDRDGDWVNVSRVAWMFAQSLERVAQAAPGASVPDGSGASDDPGDSPTVGLDIARIDSSAIMFDVPDGTQRAVAAADGPVTVVARSGDWVRVRLEGWVRESDVSPAGDEILTGVTGAEVRSNPDIYAGKLVQWRLQFISIQVADELRRDLPTGQSYLLARGPLPEPGFVYALLSGSQVEELEGLPPLAELEIIGRVRRGRSEQLGNPIVDVVDLEPLQ
jgi:hypothetical protein